VAIGQKVGEERKGGAAYLLAVKKRKREKREWEKTNRQD